MAELLVSQFKPYKPVIVKFEESNKLHISPKLYRFYHEDLYI